MTEQEALAWLDAKNVSCETLDQLRRYVDMLSREARRQNLVSLTSLEHVWARHIVDSIQLLYLAPSGDWLDIVGRRAITLVEPRRGRAAFLQDAAANTGSAALVRIVAARVQSLADKPPCAVISARAFAPLPQLIASAYHLANSGTCWLLPKGRSAQAEVEAARMGWHGTFELVRSATDPDSWIVVATGIRPRGSR